MLEQMKGIFKKMAGIPPDKIPPTIGLNIGKMDVNQCQCMFWDLGGQLRMRDIWHKYYSEAHGLIFVIDSADPGRFEEAKQAFDAVRSHEELRGIPVLLVANKQDLPGAVSPEELERIFSWGGTTPFRVQPVSCLTCEGIADGIRWEVEEARGVVRD
jgi:ADP-ribosylation factor related protein 1